MSIFLLINLNKILGVYILEKLVITGKTPLKGEVVISGAKNAAVAIIPATLLINGTCTIENLPNISDVKLYCDILKELGAEITWNTEHEVRIDTRNINSNNIPLETTRKFRASYYLLGSLLGRCKHATIGSPGGCNLGARPIDQHIKTFEALGATVDVSNGTEIQDEKWHYSKSDDSFELYLDGEYNSNNFSIQIKEYDIDKKLNKDMEVNL